MCYKNFWYLKKQLFEIILPDIDKSGNKVFKSCILAVAFYVLPFQLVLFGNFNLQYVSLNNIKLIEGLRFYRPLKNE